MAQQPVDSAQLLLKMESYWNSYLDTNPPGIRFGRSPSGTPVPLHDIDDKSRARYTKRFKRVPNGWSLTDVKGTREHALILVPDAPRTILRLWTENNSEGGKGLSRRTWVEEVSKTYRGVSRDDIRFLLQIITTLDGPWSAFTETADLTQRLESPDRDNDDYEFGIDAETERVELELEELRPIGPPRKKRKQSTKSTMATNATENAYANPNATTVNTTTTDREAMATTMNITEANPATKLPRVTIQFCTQCKWMLRAAYFAQELLSTFEKQLGEVSLQPSTSGTFIVELYHLPPSNSADNVSDPDVRVQKSLLWDRKAEGGFPETKELKRRVRDIIAPDRNLGHVDRHNSSAQPTQPTPPSQAQPTQQLPAQSPSLQSNPTQPNSSITAPSRLTPATFVVQPLPNHQYSQVPSSQQQQQRAMAEQQRQKEVQKQQEERRRQQELQWMPTNVDVDGLVVRGKDKGLKLNADGTVCEDCN